MSTGSKGNCNSFMLDRGRVGGIIIRLGVYGFMVA